MFRILHAVWFACFAVVAILLFAAPEAAGFGFVALALIFTALGLSMATNAGGPADAVSRQIAASVWSSASFSPKLAQVWGAICFVLGS